MISENKLGGLAVLRNLRNMQEVGVSDDLIRQGIAQMNTSRVLPFRFVAAARYAPSFEDVLEKKMFESIEKYHSFGGKTVALIDVSGSMDINLSNKSDMKRMDAACGLAMILRELSDDINIFSFSYKIAEIPNRRGFALRDAIIGSQRHGGTYLGQAVDFINKTIPNYGRLIVFTDEQSHDRVSDPIGNGICINVANCQNGIGYHSWTHIDGFSESVFDYLQELEY
jgi:hypothetical protein